jgi:Amt family ammonium transporter
MIYTQIRHKQVDITMVINGILAGLVAVTAGCNVVSHTSALIIGLIAGILVDIAVITIDRMKIDDPVGAIAVHGVNGFFGTVAVGLFSTKNGLFTTGSFDGLMVQILGVVAIAIFSFATSYGVLTLLNKIMGIRISRIEEQAGIDHVEYGVEAYSTFE